MASPDPTALCDADAEAALNSIASQVCVVLQECFVLIDLLYSTLLSWRSHNFWGLKQFHSSIRRFTHLARCLNMREFARSLWSPQESSLSKAPLQVIDMPSQNADLGKERVGARGAGEEYQPDGSG